jgi:translation initiation factor 4E
LVLFCRHYVFLKRPSELPTNVNLYLFREKLFPSWESYPNGGCWIVKLKKAVGVTSKLWQDLVRPAWWWGTVPLSEIALLRVDVQLFATIGELFDDLNVVGVAMSIRSSRDMLSVWNKDNNNPETKFKIGWVRFCLPLRVGDLLVGLGPATS